MSKASQKIVQPGTVVILLSGSYAGTRAVALKTAGSKVIVSGLYSANRAPVMLVEKSRLIVTSTSVDVSTVDVEKITVECLAKKGAAAKCDVLKNISASVSAIISKDECLAAYMKSKFSLDKTFGVPPHALKF